MAAAAAEAKPADTRAGSPSESAASRRAGRVSAVLAAFLFSWTSVLTRAYEDAGGQAAALVLLRMQLAVLVFGIVAIRWRRRKPSISNVLLGLGLGVFQFAYNSALVLGFARAPASLIVLLLYIYPILVVVGAAFLFGERVGRRRALLIGVGMSGLVLVVGSPGTVTVVGLAYGLAAGVGNALTILGFRYLLGRGLEVPEVLGLSYVLPAILSVCLFGAGAVSLPPSSSAALLTAVAFATLGSIAPIALFYSAVGRIGAGTTSVIATLEPPFTLVWAVVLLHEALTPTQLAGSAMVILAVALLSAQSAAEPQTPISRSGP